jgi:hypothetical protein
METRSKVKSGHVIGARVLITLRYVTSIVFAGFMMLNTAHAKSPGVPDHVSISASSGGSLVITWAGSIDPDGVVVGYEMIKNGSAQWLGNVLWYRDTAVTPGITYAYSIVAVDNEGRRSGASNTVTFRFSQSSQSSGSQSSSSQSSSSQSGGATSSGGSISLGDITAQAGKCIDSDGDGWGWDGVKSCRISQSSSAVSSSGTCIDEDGDGYGWDGYRTCLISESAFCVDTDGDGYGWDGHQTCIP